MTNASTAEGREKVDTPTLLGAAGAGDAARVESLLAAGADVNATSESGETALLRATAKGHHEVVRVLLAAGADTSAEREDGFTALGVAVFFGYADIVRALLAAGADPAAKGRLGTTAEKWALFSGFTEIAEMLRNPDRARTPNAAADAVKPGARVYFPDKGTFSPVVPLSKIDEPSADETQETDEFAPPSQEERVAATHQESVEPEVVTLVRPRKNDTAPPPVNEPLTEHLTEPASPPLDETASPPLMPATLMPPAARAKTPRRSWAVMAIVLALSLVAGASTGLFLLRSRRPAEAQTSPPAESPAQAVGVVTQEPQPAEPTPDAQPSPPAAQLPEAAPTAEAESQAALNAAAEDESRASNAAGDATTKRTEENTPTAPNASRDATSKNRRDREADAAARRDATAAARARRPAPAAVEKTAGPKPRAAAPRRPQRTEARAATVSPRDNSTPVFSPKPSAKTEKVIPWP